MATGLVGTGFIGPVHVEALRRLGRPVAGILGSSPSKSKQAAAALGLAKGYENYQALLADPAVHVVHLTSPNRHHFEQCRLALQAGKHVVCEKPLAMNPRESAELANLARRSGKTAAVCYNMRFYPLCLEARQRIRNGDLGRIQHITGCYLQDWLLWPTDFNWRVLAKEGGELRAVADIGTHWLDLLQFVTGLQVTDVCADLATFVPTRQRPKGSVATFVRDRGTAQDTEPVAIDTEDYGAILQGWEQGVRGSCTVSQVQAGRKNCLRFEIAGSKGSMAWNSERPNELWLGRRDGANELLVRDPALLAPEVRPYANYPGGHNEGFPDSFKQLFRAVYQAMDQGPATPEYPTFADGHRAIVLGAAILSSHRERRWVEVEAIDSGGEGRQGRGVDPGQEGAG